jgi:hypothetical protein
MGAHHDEGSHGMERITLDTIEGDVDALDLDDVIAEVSHSLVAQERYGYIDLPQVYGAGDYSEVFI